MSELINRFTFPETDPATGDKVWTGKADKGIAPYLLSDDIEMALKVALITRRPLLISGPPGCGKTALASAIAEAQGWNFLKHTLTSRSRLEDLTGNVDHLQRLHDAQSSTAQNDKLKPDWAYLQPGLFWWGFNGSSAKLRGQDAETVKKENDVVPPAAPGNIEEDANGTVILLDEIDKAEPDLPNDLLEPIDNQYFTLKDGNRINAEEGKDVLVLITTNGERDLPPAFLRRCIHIEMHHPTPDLLVRIARYHFQQNAEVVQEEQGQDRGTLFEALAEQFRNIQQEAKKAGQRQPGTSEFLDTVKACIELNVGPDSAMWAQLQKAVLRKF